MTEVRFFTTSGTGCFTRLDMEEGHWVQQEMTVHAVFPFDSEKVITRGMRMTFRDPATNNLEAFEIRQVQNTEPDHYQQIEAEHIVIAELSDEHINSKEIDGKTPAQALATVLTGTLWSVGTANAANISSCDISRGDVWQAVNQIAENWNVYITPRVTISGTGTISGRYLDIAPAQGTFRGLRLSIDKNMSDASVEYDDTEVLTALYGYGGSVEVPQTSGDDKREELTFASAVWSATSDHPAKPLNQTYLEWPAKTAIYGRNGRPRYGYYQNGDISDPNVLLQMTWEALKKSSEPKIRITGTCADLTRLGYTDIPMRIHDQAVVEVRQTGEKFYREIVCLDVDLVDPSNNRPEIGDYIPNIIYIDRDTRNQAAGRGGGGGRGQTNREDQDSKWWTDWVKDNTRIGMLIGYKDGENYIKTGQICLAINEDESTGAWINADHVNISGTQTAHMLAGELEYDQNGRLVIKNANGLYVDRDGTQFGVFDNGNLTSGIIVNKINGGTVKINAAHIELNGETVAESLKGQYIECNSVTAWGTCEFKDGVTFENDVTFHDAVSVNQYPLNVSDITISGNTMTILYTDGSTQTFSRATTLSGAWSSGVFTVTATGANSLTTALTNTGHWGNSANGEDENTYYYATYATIGASPTPVSTGNVTTISGQARYNAGYTDGRASVTTIQPTNIRASDTASGTSLGAISMRSGQYLTFNVGSTGYRVQVYVS